MEVYDASRLLRIRTGLLAVPWLIYMLMIVWRIYFLTEQTNAISHLYLFLSVNIYSFVHLVFVRMWYSNLCSLYSLPFSLLSFLSLSVLLRSLLHPCLNPKPSLPFLIYFDINEDLLDLTINDPTTATFNELTIIWRIISDKLINFKAVKAILTNVWGIGAKTQISYLEPVCLRRNLSCCCQSMVCPWTHNNPEELVPWLALADIEFHFSPFWIQIHHLPLNRMNEDNAVKFGNFIGTFVRTDWSFTEKEDSKLP